MIGLKVLLETASLFEPKGDPIHVCAGFQMTRCNYNLNGVLGSLSSGKILGVESQEDGKILL